MNKKTIIYGLYSSRKPDELRYIGQTTQNLKTRLVQHINYSKNKRTAVHKWMNREITEGFEILINPILDDAVFNVTEKKVIAEYRANGARLLNLTDGGEGTLGWHGGKGKKRPDNAERNKRIGHLTAHPMSAENKIKLIAAVKARDTTYLSARNMGNTVWLGRKHSEETKEKIREATLGRIVSVQTRLKISVANKGKKRTKEQVDNLRAAHKAYYEILRKNA